jgi:hypothetical protein
MSSSSFVVVSCVRLSSCTKVQHMMSSKNTEMTLTSATLGISWHFCEKRQM